LDNGLIRHQGRLWIGNLALQSRYFLNFTVALLAATQVHQLLVNGMKKQIQKWGANVSSLPTGKI
jgi:hypothetical protein